MKNLIYAVEDDESIGELYKLTFESSGYEIEIFQRAEDMLRVLQDNPCDLVIMDMMLPGMDGIEAVRKIRANFAFEKLPIIMISAKGSEVDKVKGLDAGADDYLSKPFGVLELLARTKANLRKAGKGKDEPEILTYEEIILNDGEHKCFISDQEVTMTLKEFNLLKILLKNAESVVKREKILNEVWGYEYFGETRTLDMHIMSLRNKISALTSSVYIHTVRGVGYRLGKQ